MVERSSRRILFPAIMVAVLIVMLIFSHLLPYTQFVDPKIEQGYSIELVSENLGGPACLEWAEADVLIVCDRDEGRLVALEFDFNTINSTWNLVSTTTWLEDFIQPHGIHFDEDFIVVSDLGRLTRINHSGPDTTWMDSIQSNERWVLIDEVPVGNHQTNAVNELGNGTLVWHVGSTCNVCEEEDERNAALLWVDPETGENAILASGVRNSYDGVWVGGLGYLFSDNGRDWEGDHPLEEVNLLIAGEDYGWPEDDPEHPIPAGTIGPVATWTAHSSLNGMAVRPEISTFPGSEYTVYATVFGSWNAVIPVGHEIVQIDFTENISQPQGWQGDVTSFATDLGTPLPIVFHSSGNYLFYATFAGGGSLNVITTEDVVSA